MSFYSQNKALKLAGIVVIGALLSFAVSFGVSASGTTPPTPTPNLVPVQLPASAGLARTSGMTLVSQVATPIWLGHGNSPVSSTDLGLTGSLMQSWVSSAAAQTYGVGSGLILPVPLEFATSHPGPVEATVRILSFNSPASAATIASNPAFSHVGDPAPGFNVLTGSGINGGTAIQINSDANDGLTEFQFQWVSGSSWYQVSVLGSPLTIVQASQLAAQVAA